MNTTIRTGGRRVLTLTLVLTLLCCVMLEAPALAAGFTSLKPRIKTNESAYIAGSVALYWTKVSGATGYEVYRASTKNGAYKKFATSKKTSLKKKTSGAYFYKVRAVKGSQKSKFSNPVQIFAATGRITNVTFSGTSGLQVRVQVANKSSKNMNFLAGNYCMIYLVDKVAQEAVDSTMAGLVVPSGAGIILGPKKQQALWLQIYNYTLWTAYQGNPNRYTWLVTIPFYPGNGDDVATPFALAAGTGASDSAVAARE